MIRSRENCKSLLMSWRYLTIVLAVSLIGVGKAVITISMGNLSGLPITDIILIIYVPSMGMVFQVYVAIIESSTK